MLSNYCLHSGSVWSLDGAKSVSGSMTKNLKLSVQENSLDDISEDFSFTSVHPRNFSEYKSDSHCTAVRMGIKLGQLLLQQGAKEILDEVKFHSQNQQI